MPDKTFDKCFSSSSLGILVLNAQRWGVLVVRPVRKRETWVLMDHPFLCTYIYIYVCVYMHIYVYIHVYTHTYLDIIFPPTTRLLSIHVPSPF